MLKLRIGNRSFETAGSKGFACATSIRGNVALIAVDLMKVFNLTAAPRALGWLGRYRLT
jgi:hypothetical protein